MHINIYKSPGVWYSSPHQSPRVPNLIFTPLHRVQSRSSDDNSVRLSVRPSVRLSVYQTRDLWQIKEKSVQIFMLYERLDLLVQFFLRKRMVGGGRPLLLVILGQAYPVGAKSLMSVDIRS